MSEYIINDSWINEYENNIEDLIGFDLSYDSATNPVPPLRRIVRCRDCVHAEPEGEPPRKGYEGLLWCDYLTEGIGFSVLPHNFCAWGKRKEGGE